MEQSEQALTGIRQTEKPATCDGVRLYAQPYDISACGFFFASEEEYLLKAGRLRNGFGQPVEEFEIQFVDGELIDADLFRALGVHQGNFGAFLGACAAWDVHQKVLAVIAAGELGHAFGPDFDPEGFDIDVYEEESMIDLAREFLAEGLFGDLPETICRYLDWDAIARDMAMDYAEVRIANNTYIFRGN